MSDSSKTKKNNVDARQAAFKALFDQDPDQLIACPACDTLHRSEPVAHGQIARCTRCHYTLFAPKPDTLNRTIALALTSAVVMIAMLSFPFLTMSKSGLSHQISILGIVANLAHGWFLLLSIAFATFVIALPMVRAAALIYVMLALKQNRVAPFSKGVYRFTEWVAPWAMVEVFIVGTGIALAKVAGLASVSFDHAFWLLCLLVLIVAAQNAAVCRWTIWTLIREHET